MKNNTKILNKVYENESDFIKCGITGWCLEVVWTGMINFLNNDKKLSRSEEHTSELQSQR